MITDHYNRNIDYIRISITDRCNLRCRYCMPEDISFVGHDKILRYEEITRIVQILAQRGITKVKITGGEPLVRHGCTDLIREIKEIPGIEMVTLDNGATVKSIHGALKREPAQTSYKVFGTKGFLGTCADAEGEKVRLYQESATQTCAGENRYIVPEKFVSAELAKNSGVATHGGSDFYPTHFFIEKILGHEDGKWSIDVYQAVDMGICGILAFRSILNGNMPIKVPNLRNKEERDAWRHDNACTNAAVAGDQVLPCSSYPERTLDPEEVARNRAIWEKRQGRG